MRREGEYDEIYIVYKIVVLIDSFGGLSFVNEVGIFVVNSL